jgi:signal transduction histidine kinase
VEQARVQADVKRQTITLEAPESVPATIDARKMEQVIDNLVSNAIKYTPDGGTISVAVVVSGNRATVSVADTGSGIPPDELRHLFSKYHRAPGQQTDAVLGTGLGLVIIKEIAEAHGGTVRAESEGIPGKGSTFIVDIPLLSADVLAAR